tara:strand:- start:57 stop:227 length:171 start_codon:yes stop_codon:yes gene_type:complete
MENDLKKKSTLKRRKKPLEIKEPISKLDFWKAHDLGYTIDEANCIYVRLYPPDKEN